MSAVESKVRDGSPDECGHIENIHDRIDISSHVSVKMSIPHTHPQNPQGSTPENFESVPELPTQMTTTSAALCSL